MVLAEAAAQLRRADCRLLTLTGPPGVGKTRLALALAAEVEPDFRDGARFVSLAPLVDPALVAASIAKAVGLHEAGGSGSLEERLVDWLRPRASLLVLDNFEQVREAGSLVVDLLHACPQLRVLVTSRVALRLSGELDFPLAPLELPAPTRRPAETLAANPAVALFVARARAVYPALVLDAEAMDLIARVCRRLEGIPLAIELAAARSRVFSPKTLLSRLDQRFDVLTHGARDLPPRQQSLQAALDWSYELLAPEEQRLFRRAAVFAGSFTLESAEAVCNADRTIDSDVADGLEALLDHSLLRVERTAEGATRFGMLDTINEYALVRLHQEEGPAGTPQAMRREHARHFTELAEMGERQLRGPGQPDWLARLEAEHDNLRAALAWCVEHREPELGWRLGGALWQFWLMRGHLSEARRWLEAVLAIPGPAAPTRAKALCGAGVMARYQGDFVTARARLASSEALYRDSGNTWGLADTLTHLGSIERYTRDPQAARAHLDESLHLWRELGDHWGLALALSARAGLANDEADYERARALREESLQRYRAAGDREGAAQALIGLGEVARCQGDEERAQDSYEQALDLFREMGSRLYIAVALQNLGHVLIQRGNAAEAWRHFIESLTLFRALGHQVGVAACLAGLAGVEVAIGRAHLAAILLGSAERIMDALGTKLAAADRAAWDHTWAAAIEALGAEAAGAARLEGGGLSVEEAIARISEHGPPSPQETAHRPTPTLTGRELAVLRLLAEGLSYADIGQRLSISHRTVDAHLRSIYSKLDVRSRHEAVHRAADRHLI